MKLLLLLIIALSFSFNSINAEESNNNPGEAFLSSTTATHHVVYNIINKNPQDTNGDGYIDQLNFTVIWQYTGPLEYPQIVYIVKLKNSYGTELLSFQDSKRGAEHYGSKNYSIKSNTAIKNEEVMHINYFIEGSDGSYAR
ncbi:hypothetical protein NXY11_11460 [Parabacteroides faecis]|uniref:hypothetical protein n=1 Tax=Parabacteroides faecis TaxID=1217282 RepID=UPI0021649518|nr:hypothetical protein [Parabacteroides faecis]MCS2892567.1 hypothetical protein [Parabacteroides faecis]UVQ48796.1 hypothetical protein NXY11_11460 [Parabacteroides faecis]